MDDAALKAASWGILQILGENYRSCGCSCVQDFVKRMSTSTDEQLILGTKFICSSSRIKNALIQKDWASFARYYNGPGYEKNKYDTKLKAAYDSIKASES